MKSITGNATLLTDKWSNETFNDWNATVASNGPTVRPYWMGVLDQASTVIMTINLISLMLGMGAATYLREIWINMKRPWGSLIGMICQFGLLPAIGFALCILLKLPPYQSLGVLILTCSPGGAFSNFFTYWVDGDIALSILMTSTSSLLAFGGMPLNLWIYTSYWTDDQLKIPYYNVLISMCFVTGPALVGMIIRHCSRIWATRLSQLCGILGWAGAFTVGLFMLLIYWDIIITTSINVLIAAACVPIVGFSLSYVMARIFCMSNKTSRTIGIETGCQNMVVATNVILLSYSDANIRGQMVMFPTIYGVFQLSEIFIGILIFQIYKFIHRDDVTEEEVKSVVDTTVLKMVPVPIETQIRKPVNWEPYQDRPARAEERFITDRSSPRSPIRPLRNEDESPFIKPESLNNSGEGIGGTNYVSPYYDVIRVGPMTGRQPSWRRYSDYADESRERVYDEATHAYETADTLPARPANEPISTQTFDQRFPLSSRGEMNILSTPRSPSLNTGYDFRTFGSASRR